MMEGEEGADNWDDEENEEEEHSNSPKKKQKGKWTETWNFLSNYSEAIQCWCSFLLFLFYYNYILLLCYKDNV